MTYLSNDPNDCVKPSLQGKECKIIKKNKDGISCTIQCKNQTYSAFNSQIKER